MAAKRDYYDVLGIQKGASEGEVKSAYRKKAVEWHPDKHKDNKEEAEVRFKEINEAYQVLSDSQKKQAYDQFGHAAFSRGAGGAPQGNPFGQGGFGGRSGPFTYTYTSQGGPSTAGFDFGDPFEIFEQFFGGRGGFRSQSLPRYSIDIDFMEAVRGVEKDVSVGGKRRKIKIPLGVDDGNRIQFDDFILSINVRPSREFERDGADIYSVEKISFSLAALGGEIGVKTVDDNVKIKVRAGTQSGVMIRLRGKGMPHLRGRGRGDHYVRVQVEVPTKLSWGQKRILKELQEDGL